VINAEMYDLPGTAAKPTGQVNLCKDVTGTIYTTQGAAGALGYNWMVEPEAAGTISSLEATGTLTLNPGFTGALAVKVKAVGECGSGVFSEELPVTVIDVPAAPAKPTGADSINLNKLVQTDFSISEVPGATQYAWNLNPATAGAITGTGLTGTVNWNSTYRGVASVVAKALNTCGESLTSEEKTVKLYAPVGIQENESNLISVTPNPNNGRFTLDINAGFSTLVVLTVYNTQGVVVYSETDVKVNGNLHKNLDLTNLAKGSYLLKVEGKGISSTINIVVGK
jgi:hypothetical protein